MTRPEVTTLARVFHFWGWVAFGRDCVVALMVKMQIDRVDRPRVKLECLRMMVKLKLDKARSQLIGKFMTDYLKLTSAETVVYNTAMANDFPQRKRRGSRSQQ